jgi:hypothetical protein
LCRAGPVHGVSVLHLGLGQPSQQMNRIWLGRHVVI